METILIDLAANYGLGGIMVAAFMWTIHKFVTHISVKDAQIQGMHSEMVEVVKQNAAASAELITIIKLTNNRD